MEAWRQNERTTTGKGQLTGRKPGRTQARASGWFDLEKGEAPRVIHKGCSRQTHI